MGIVCGRGKEWDEEMKKMLALALVLAMLSAAAMAAPGDAVLLHGGEDGEYGSVCGLAEADGTVYLLADALYTLEEGQDVFTRHELALDSSAAKFWETGAVDGGVVTRHEAVSIIAYGGRPCLIAVEYADEYFVDDGMMGYYETIEGVYLHELAFDGESRATLGERIVELEWDDLIQSYEDFEELAGVFLPVVIDDMLYMKSYDAGDSEMLVATNLADGATDVLYTADLTGGLSLEGLCAYQDGKLLGETVVWGETENTVALHAIDFDAETMETLVEFSCPAVACPGGLAYRAGSDTLYFAMNREIYAMTGLNPETMQAVAEIPVGSLHRVAPILTADGFYIAGDSDAVVRRNIDPSLRAATRLTVQNGYAASLENAYYAFANQNSGVEVVLADSTQALVQAMLGHSSMMDVYCVEVELLEYEAVSSRGYMPAIESETIRAFLESCYPFVRDVCMQDGQAVAVPVEIYLQGRLGYNSKLLEEIGLSAEDLPGTWAEFFASLEPLAQKVATVPGASLFAGDYDAESMSVQLFDEMMSSYVTFIAQPGNEFTFDTPAFRAILEAFESVNWKALGLSAPDGDWEDETGAGGTASAAAAPTIEVGGNALFSLDTYVTAEGYTAISAYDALPLAIDDGAQPQLLAGLLVAFVNPYSEHPEEAVAFLETLVREMNGVLKIHLSPENNEPLPKAQYQQELDAYDEQLAMLRKQLETADADTAGALEARIAQYEEQRERFARYDGWLASDQSIARYRSIAGNIAIKRNIGLSGDNEGAYYTQMQQYLDGAIPAGAFIAGMDGQLQMMMKEGM